MSSKEQTKLLLTAQSTRVRGLPSFVGTIISSKHFSKVDKITILSQLMHDCSLLLLNKGHNEENREDILACINKIISTSLIDADIYFDTLYYYSAIDCIVNIIKTSVNKDKYLKYIVEKYPSPETFIFFSRINEMNVGIEIITPIIKLFNQEIQAHNQNQLILQYSMHAIAELAKNYNILKYIPDLITRMVTILKCNLSLPNYKIAVKAICVINKNIRYIQNLHLPDDILDILSEYIKRPKYKYEAANTFAKLLTVCLPKKHIVIFCYDLFADKNLIHNFDVEYMQKVGKSLSNIILETDLADTLNALIDIANRHGGYKAHHLYIHLIAKCLKNKVLESIILRLLKNLSAKISTANFHILNATFLQWSRITISIKDSYIFKVYVDALCMLLFFNEHENVRAMCYNLLNSQIPNFNPSIAQQVKIYLITHIYLYNSLNDRIIKYACVKPIINIPWQYEKHILDVTVLTNYPQKFIPSAIITNQKTLQILQLSDAETNHKYLVQCLKNKCLHARSYKIKLDSITTLAKLAPDELMQIGSFLLRRYRNLTDFFMILDLVLSEMNKIGKIDFRLFDDIGNTILKALKSDNIQTQAAAINAVFTISKYFNINYAPHEIIKILKSSIQSPELKHNCISVIAKIYSKISDVKLQQELFELLKRYLQINNNKPLGGIILGEIPKFIDCLDNKKIKDITYITLTAITSSEEQNRLNAMQCFNKISEKLPKSFLNSCQQKLQVNSSVPNTITLISDLLANYSVSKCSNKAVHAELIKSYTTSKP